MEIQTTLTPHPLHTGSTPPTDDEASTEEVTTMITKRMLTAAAALALTLGLAGGVAAAQTDGDGDPSPSQMPAACTNGDMDAMHDQMRTDMPDDMQARHDAMHTGGAGMNGGMTGCHMTGNGMSGMSGGMTGNGMMGS